MIRGYLRHILDTVRPHQGRSLLLSVKLLIILFFLSTVVMAQFSGKTPPDGAICPLSESQTKKSMEAFSKIATAISKENRCLGCHGRVNPHIDGTGADPENPDAAPSEFEHGAGKVDRKSDCNECHNHMARRTRDGSESVWMTAPDFLSFIGKDATTLCKQIRENLPSAKDFMGHLKDDNGGNNFAGTAFNGDRGLDRTMFPEKEVPTEKPLISQAAFLGLGQDWVASTGGEFKGDKSCGCEPAHFAIRISSNTKFDYGPIHHESSTPSQDVPITFKDDGTYEGKGVANFTGASTVEACSGQSNVSLNFSVTGKAIETAEEQSMHIQLENTSADASTFNGQCPGVSVSNKQDSQSQKTVLPFDFTGNVGEFIDQLMPAPVAGLVSTMHVEIVKVD